MVIERPGISGLSSLWGSWQEKEKYAILFLWIKNGGVCMAERMAEQIAEILKESDFHMAEKALAEFQGSMD